MEGEGDCSIFFLFPKEQHMISIFYAISNHAQKTVCIDFNYFFFWRDKMGNYAKAVQVLQKQLMEAILEALGLNFGNLQKEINSWPLIATQHVLNQTLH